MKNHIQVISIIVLFLLLAVAPPARAQSGGIMTFDLGSKLINVVIPEGYCQFEISNAVEGTIYNDMMQSYAENGRERVLILFADCTELETLRGKAKQTKPLMRIGVIGAPAEKDPIPLKLPADQKKLNAAMDKNYFSWAQKEFMKAVRKNRTFENSQFFGKLFADETAMYWGSKTEDILTVTGTMNLKQRAVHLTLTAPYIGNPQELKLLARKVQEGVKAIRAANPNSPSGG